MQNLFSVSGVEIDRKITNLSHTYSDLPASVPTATYDSHAFLATDNGMYDVSMVAYQDITIPFYMSTAEFFQLVKNHLSPSGILVVNMNMHADDSDSLIEYLCDTIASVFPYIHTVDVPGMTNRELFAGTSEDPDSTLRSHLSQLPSSELKQFLPQINEWLLPYRRVSYLLTDDKAPWKFCT